jgi:ubiquinone/menaquinone biosynthesis C-methylase UbiE/uncharacterized protein YbaR (Trm112 family)
MKKADIKYFCCLSCKKDLVMEGFADGESQDLVDEGVLLCTGCGTYYPVIDGIPFLLDRGYYLHFDLAAFQRKWSGRFDFGGFAVLDRKTVPEKLQQVTFYEKDAEVYDDLVVDSKFWKAHGDNIVDDWIALTPRDGVVLDVGCGTGRCSLRFSQSERYVVGTDISFAMLKKAAERERNAGLPSTTYFLADSEDLPVKPEMFTNVIAYGLLHHTNNPDNVVKGVKGALRKGGVFCVHDNHDSPIRPLFDMMMKVWKLWNEEAGSNPLFKIVEFRELFKRNGMAEEIRTSVFLPPHIFRFISYGYARKLLRFTDRFLGCIPLIRDFGGQLVVTARKE